MPCCSTAASVWSCASASPAAPAPSSTGATISPAPWAVDIRNDHHASSPRDTRALTQRKCARGFTKRKMPKTTSAIPAPMRSALVSARSPRPSTREAATSTDASCPIAIGGSARTTARRSRSCIPSATANSHPIAGFSPW
jgi:hypothetical protein